MCSDHDEVMLEEKIIKEHPEGIEYYRFKTSLDTSDMHSNINKSKLTVLFDSD
jgi:hypothetical protein